MTQTVLVTGSNRGIGLELCKQLQQRGMRVIGCCRVSSAALSALGVEVIENVEVASAESLAVLANTLKGQSIDWLIANAGIADGVRSGIATQTLEASSIASAVQMFEVNSLGPLLTTQALLDNLSVGSKVAIVTSRMGSVADNDSGGSYGYRMSKAAVNAAGKSLSIDLKPLGVAVALLHPGYVRTDMTGHNGLIDCDESVAGLLARIDELSLENSGGFWHSNGECLQW